jgi:hypothetical protein
MSADYSVSDSNINISSGETHETSGIEIFHFDGAAIVLNGDSNSTNLDVVVRARFDETNQQFSHYTEFTGLDLTQYQGSRKILNPIETVEVNDFKIVITNNAGSSTTLDFRVAKADGDE